MSFLFRLSEKIAFALFSVPGQPGIVNPTDLASELEAAILVGGARDAGRGRIPVDASAPDAAGFRLLVASEDGREARVGDEVRLVPGQGDDQLDYDEAIVIGNT